MRSTIKDVPAVTAERTQKPDNSDLLTSILARVDAIAVQQSRPSPVSLRTWDEIERFAEKAARSSMVPLSYRGKPDDILMSVQMGMELGLAPMQALQNIAAVNGRPSVWGDAMPGLCRASGKVDYIKEWMDGDTAHCEAKRRDDPNPVHVTFSIADAKKAGLAGKAGPWTQYPARMLQMRARGFALRDAFPDVLRGLISAEEAADIPFEATGLTIPQQMAAPEPEPECAPSMPPKKQGRTLGMALADIEEDLKKATIREEVDAILAGETMQKITALAKGTAQERLNDIVQAALARFPEDDEPMSEDDEFPGDMPEGGK